MKRLLAALVLFVIVSCEKDAQKPAEDVPCGDYKGNQTYKTEKGACYIFNSNGEKVYVDKSECDDC
jgi:hypothetical protein